MISKAGIVFEKKTLEKRKKKTHEGLDGDSGVGQAPESSFKPLFLDKTVMMGPAECGSQTSLQTLPPSFETNNDWRDHTGEDSVWDTLARVTRGFFNIALKILSQVRSASQHYSRIHTAGKVKNKSHYSPLSLRFISTIGSLLILISVIGAGLTYGPLIVAEARYRMRQLFATQNSQRGSFADILSSALIGDIENAPDPNFSLVIPKIGARGKIIPNVDAGNEAEYMDALKIGIAHAKGTELPGSPGTIYMFAHSTDSPLNIIRYNAVFYLLRELQAGDEVLVYFSGAKHRYRVTQTKIVEPTDIEYLSSINPDNKELLILQTCWPPGTRLKRFLVFAKKPADLPPVE